MAGSLCADSQFPPHQMAPALSPSILCSVPPAVMEERPILPAYPEPPWRPVSEDIFPFLYQILNFSLFMGLCFLHEDGVLWSLDLNPPHSELLAHSASPRFLNVSHSLPSHSDCTGASLGLECFIINLSSTTRSLNHCVKVRFLCSLPSYILISLLSIYHTL